MGNYVMTSATLDYVSKSDLTCVSDAISCCATKSDVKIAIDELKKTPEVPTTTRTMLETRGNNIYVKYFEDGFFKTDRQLMPDIVDVNVYDNTVVVTFADKTKTNAVLDSEDTFSIEQGISICIAKKLIGKEGHSIYNKLIDKGLNVMKRKEKAAETAVKEKEAAKQARALKKARSERRKAKKREEIIDMHAEAYKRAMTYMFSGKAN